MLSLTYFYREPRKTGVSIEGIFHSVKDCLKDRVAIKEFYCDPKLSRLQNILQARTSVSTINHITGDVNFLAMGLGGKKTVLTIHDLGYYENPAHSKMVKLIYHTFWFYLPLKFADTVTVVSEFTKQKLIRYFHFPESRIRVIPNPVKKVFRYTPVTKNNARQSVLMMGSGKHKNLDNLIAAAQGTDMHLDIIGWPAKDELIKLKELGISHTIYNGLTEEQVYERYAACDVLFMASLYEGFGMPVIEAQCVGRPVITSNIGAMLELGEGSAILVDPLQPEQIRAAILSLQDKELYAATVARGIKNAEQYTCEKIAQQYLEVYEQLAAK